MLSYSLVTHPQILRWKVPIALHRPACVAPVNTNRKVACSFIVQQRLFDLTVFAQSGHNNLTYTRGLESQFLPSEIDDPS